MNRIGVVKSCKGNILKVCFDRPEGCAGCKGCEKGFMSPTELLTVFGKAEPGDLVSVRIPENKTLSAALLAYGLPLLLLLAGLFIASGAGLADGLILLCALAGMVIGYGISKLIEKQLRGHGDWCPTVEKIINKGMK